MALPILVGGASVFLYDEITSRIAWGAPSRIPVFLWTIAVLAAVFSFIRYPAEAKAVRVLVAGLGATLAAYGIALGADIATAEGATALTGALFGAPVLLGLAGVLALFRPSFAVVPCVYVALHKDLTRAVSGAGELGLNDYLPLVEVGLFLAVGVLALAVLKLLISRSVLPARVVENAGAVLLAAAIGMHFGNYFMSGLAKVMLDGGPLTWALENPTSALMLNGYNLGVAPLSAWPPLFAGGYEAFQAVEIPLNFVTLFVQLGCVLAFLHRRLLLGVTLFFDVMHISIFILTGALFLPWIILNSLMVAALLRLPRATLPVSAIVVGMIITVFGHTVFYNAQLGWYDSPQARTAYFTAIHADGSETRVPGSFFRDASYLMYARHFGYREYRRPTVHIPTSAWGQIGIKISPSEKQGTSYEVMALGRDCAYPVAAEPTTDYDTARPAPFIRGQHARALNDEARGNAHGYNAYPHHHFSMPWLYRDFGAYPLSDVVAYRYVVETVCLSVENGELRRDVLARTATDPIPVVQPFSEIASSEVPAGE